MYWFSPSVNNLDRYNLFDSISLYNPHISNERIIKRFWENLYLLYEKLVNFSNENQIRFIPTVLPGFNDLNVRPNEKHPVIERNIKEMKKLEDNLKKLGIKEIYICSFNEWHEGTQIEN